MAWVRASTAIACSGTPAACAEAAAAAISAASCSAVAQRQISTGWPSSLLGARSSGLASRPEVFSTTPAAALTVPVGLRRLGARGTWSGGRERGKEAVHARARSATEPIDALVVVTDDAHVPPASRDQLYQALLRQVGVLVFVDQHPSEVAGQTLADVFVLLEQTDGVPEQ